MHDLSSVHVGSRVFVFHAHSLGKSRQEGTRREFSRGFSGHLSSIFRGNLPPTKDRQAITTVVPRAPTVTTVFCSSSGVFSAQNCRPGGRSRQWQEVHRHDFAVPGTAGELPRDFVVMGTAESGTYRRKTRNRLQNSRHIAAGTAQSGNLPPKKNVPDEYPGKFRLSRLFFLVDRNGAASPGPNQQ